MAKQVTLYYRINKNKKHSSMSHSLFINDKKLEKLRLTEGTQLKIIVRIIKQGWGC